MPTIRGGSGGTGSGLANGFTIWRTDPSPNPLCMPLRPRTLESYLEPNYARFLPHASTSRVEQLDTQQFAVGKIPNASGLYDSDAYSPLALTGDFAYRIAFAPFATGDGVFGLSVDPLSGVDDTNMTHRMRVIVGTGIYWWKAGVLTGGPSTYDTYAWIYRIGGTIYFATGATAGTILDSVADSATYYADSSYIFDQFDYSSGGGHVVSLYNATPSFPSAISGTSTLAFAASATMTGTGFLTATAPLTFAPTAALTGSGALVGASTLSFAPSATIKGLAPVTGTSALSFAPSGTATGTAALSGTSPLTFAPTATITGKGALTGTSTLVLSPTGTATGKGALTGASSLNFAPAATISGRASISGTSPLTFAGSGTITGKGDLSGTAPLSFVPSGTISSGTSAGALTGTSSLAFTLTGTVTGFAGSSSISFTAAGNIRGLKPVTGSASFRFRVSASLRPLLVGTTSLGFAATGMIDGPDGWTDIEAPPATYVNDNPQEATWTDTNPAEPAFGTIEPDTTTWTESPPSSGTWN